MPKEKTDAATLAKFESALRKALNTPAELHKPLKQRAKRKKKRARGK